MLSKSDIAPSSRTQIGKAGQTSSLSLTGVLDVQRSCKLRRSGDPKTMFRQCRHTCTSVCQASIPSDERRRAWRIYNSNMSRNTSSGRTSIVTWPTTQSVVVQVAECCKKDRCRPCFVNFFKAPGHVAINGPSEKQSI